MSIMLTPLLMIVALAAGWFAGAWVSSRWKHGDRIGAVALLLIDFCLMAAIIWALMAWIGGGKR